MEGKKQAKTISIFGLCEGSVVSEILKGKRKEMYYFTIRKDKIILANLKKYVLCRITETYNGI